MIDYLMDIDAEALLAVNGMYSSFQDALWWMVSAKWSSALLVLSLLWILVHKNRRHALLVLAMVALAVLLVRPTHDPSLENAVHIVNGYRGGMYGFVSSHAANFFAIATLVSFIMRHRLVVIALYGWGLAQCYSRMYLGVHYPGDILGGIIVGVLAGWLVWRLMCWIQYRWRLPEGHYTRSDAVVMASAFAVTAVGLLVAALVQTM